MSNLPRRKFLGGLAAVGGMWSGLLPSSGLAAVNPLTDRLHLKVEGYPGLAAVCRHLPGRRA